MTQLRCSKPSRLQPQADSRNVDPAILAMIADRTDNGVVLADADGLVQWVNAGFTRITGYTLDEIRGRKPGTLLRGPGTDLATVDQIRRALAERRTVHVKILNYAKGGRPYWAAVEIQPLFDEDGNLKHFMAIQSDISHQRQMELERESFFTNAQDIALICDVNGYFRRVNPASLKALGYTEDEVMSRPYLDLIHPDDITRIVEAIQVVQRGQPVSAVRLRVRAADGTYRYIEWSCPGMRPGDTEFYAVGRDVTENLRITEALAQSERFARETVDALTSHIAILDDMGGIVAVNAAWRQFASHNTGHTERCHVGVNYLQICDSAQGDDAEEAVAMAQGIRQVIRGECRQYTLEYPCHSPAEKRWFIARVTRFEGDGPVRIVVAHDNITERKLAEEKLLRHTEELVQAQKVLKNQTTALARQSRQLEVSRAAAEAANRAKSAFLANMSHEIRTPMTAILGYTDLLLDSALNAEQQESMHIIRRNGDHLLTVINDILDLSKIEAGRMMVERVDCSITQIVNEVISLMRVRAEEKGLSLSVEHLFPLPQTIQSDATRLRQILTNLIANAIKFTETGGVRLITRLIEHEDHPAIRFEIIDTGIGMTHKQMRKAFLPFMQADSSMTRKFGGTGLGLAISKRLAQMLGGDIHVHSTLGQGTSFIVTIDPGPLEGVPMIDHVREAVHSVMPPQRASAEAPMQGRILLVEDGPDNQRLISFLLRKAGCEVEVAANGAVGLEAALSAQRQGKPYDVIFMDMQMPVMDGYVATQRLREQQYRLPIVALTAHAMTGDRQRCLDAGCDDYLAKPVNRDTLLHMVRQFTRPQRLSA